ncbi:hypothetical protein [Clostridium sp. CF012]|uniref:hypothetical protein n=1 Tax=Clostridium sp. CF012 TaxID=2843319 RepID=UPI001C0B276D|nr:hypothetical protein [Clostridium sp. CF012]MBU3146893.1 hypothetical protein [Clostridium sp. CF012]
MSTNTPNLNLKKINTTTDGNNTFNIDTDLNENWDKIDTKVKTLEDGIGNITVPVTRVNLKTGDVTLNAGDIKAADGATVESHLADMGSQLSGKGASLIGLNDSANKFTATNVEGAMSELFINVDNGKNSVYSAIVGKGINPTSKDFSALTSGINAIAKGQGNAVESNVQNGFTFTNNDGILRTGNHIEPTIESLGGKRIASGSGVTGQNKFATISNLLFKPSKVDIWCSGALWQFNSAFSNYVTFALNSDGSGLGSYPQAIANYGSFYGFVNAVDAPYTYNAYE